MRTLIRIVEWVELIVQALLWLAASIVAVGATGLFWGTPVVWFSVPCVVLTVIGFMMNCRLLLYGRLYVNSVFRVRARDDEIEIDWS